MKHSRKVLEIQYSTRPEKQLMVALFFRYKGFLISVQILLDLLSSIHEEKNIQVESLINQ